MAIPATSVRARSACVGVGTVTSYSGSGAAPDGRAWASVVISASTDVSRSPILSQSARFGTDTPPSDRRASGSGRGVNDGPPRWPSPTDRRHCCGSPSCSNCIPDTDTDRRADAQQGPDSLREIGIDHEREPSGHLRPPRQLLPYTNRTKPIPLGITLKTATSDRATWWIRQAPCSGCVVQRPRRDGKPPRSIRRNAHRGLPCSRNLGVCNQSGAKWQRNPTAPRYATARRRVDVRDEFAMRQWLPQPSV